MELNMKFKEREKGKCIRFAQTETTCDPGEPFEQSRRSWAPEPLSSPTRAKVEGWWGS